MFTKELADRLKERVGQKYRPSNGTEGDMFTEKFCENCVREGDGDKFESFCEIAAKSFAFDIDEPGYPPEWQYGPDGQPVCTAFERRQDA